MTRNSNRKNANHVKEWSSSRRPVPSGRDRHAPQVTPDRHQATAMKLNKTIKIATWNVRTLLQKGKFGNIKKEKERLKINVLGISEVRWKGAGMITSDNYKLVYSGGNQHESGVGIVMTKVTA